MAKKKRSRPIESVYMGMTCTVDDKGFSTDNGIQFKNTYAVLRKFLTVNSKYFLTSEVKQALTRGRRYGPFSEHHIFSEMYIPPGIFPPSGIDMIRFAVNVSALIRAKTKAQAYIPIFSTRPFCEMTSDGRKPTIGHMFVGKIQLVLTDPHELQARVTNDELTWVFKHLKTFDSLTKTSRPFRTAFEAFANAEMQPSTAQAMLMLWGGIEALLPDIKMEISYRISSYIAAFLEPLGSGRLALYKVVKDLYGGRSQVAHGSGKHDYRDVISTYALMRRLLVKCIELGHVPSQTEFEHALFIGQP